MQILSPCSGVFSSLPDLTHIFALVSLFVLYLVSTVMHVSDDMDLLCLGELLRMNIKKDLP